MMKPTFHTILFFAALSMQALAQESPAVPKADKSPNVHHVGDVWLRHLSHADDTFNYNMAVATFAPGARLDWHIHPGGQHLFITEGVGYYQERSKPLQIVHKGDIIKCLPGVEHWHGAKPDSGFTYLAVTAPQPTKWLDRVTDETYFSMQKMTRATCQPSSRSSISPKRNGCGCRRKMLIRWQPCSMKNPYSFTWRIGEESGNLM